MFLRWLVSSGYVSIQRQWIVVGSCCAGRIQCFAIFIRVAAFVGALGLGVTCRAGFKQFGLAMIQSNSHWANDLIRRARLLGFLVLILLSLSARSRATEVILVCPGNFGKAIEPWVDLRTAEGLSVRTIESELSAVAVRDRVAQIATDKTKYILLIGDVPVIGSKCDPSLEVPSFYSKTGVTAKWGSTPTLCTDYPYGDLDQNGEVEIAVGRLPVDRPEQLRNWINRLIIKEHSTDFGQWRTSVQLVGGVGGFGFLADQAIESAARTIVTGVLPAQVRTHVLYGSPGHRFYPSDEPFTEAVLNQYSKGARFWVYAGHGQVTKLDRVPQNEDGVPVLDRRSVRRLKCEPGRAPIALMLACYTGALDAAEDSLAEHLLFTEGGPIAVIAGSRVTMPYGNAALSVGLIKSIYQRRPARLGDAWLEAQRGAYKATAGKADSARVMIDGLATLLSPAGSTLVEERREHLQLYGLLGDPTQRLRHAQRIELEVAPGHDQGDPLKVIANSSVEGDLTLRVDFPLGASVGENPNETLVSQLEHAVQADLPLKLSVPVPVGTAGPMVIRAYAVNGEQFAVGSARTIIRKESNE
ncbi:C25 family cysteine peptidase [bacterium]|nr:C25 family cysteine peptidase [bacterium]